MSKILILYSIVILNLLGIIFRLYWIIPYYDKLLHFMGGFWVAMMADYLLGKYFADDYPKTFFIRALLLVGITMIIGFGWEMYEFLMDTFIFHRPFTQISVADTMTDLLADFMGGVVYGILGSGRRDANIRMHANDTNNYANSSTSSLYK